jgi:SAM-dependent methyltransferase
MLHRQGRNKPFGYAGDFQMMDWTYTQFVGPRGRGRLWDQFYHRQDAPLAVRDRKERFGRLLQDMAQSTMTRPLRILNVGSGSGRELLDGAVHARLGPEELDVLCVEIDARAVDYARTLLGDRWKRSVHFHQGNALRFRPPGEYDLVWSAGLFDYLDDRLAAFLLRILWRAVAPGGRLVVGNFATSHRTRAWIEWCGGWFLVHRSEEDAKELVNQAGIGESLVQHEEDRWKAIRFVIAVKPD